jgi:DNA polymerase III gamma/tau subunit
MPQIESMFVKMLKLEGINICEDGFKKIILLSNYNLNVIYNNLQKLILIDNNITDCMITHNCTNINYSYFEEYFEEIKQDNINLSSSVLFKLFDNGFSVNDILENLFDFVKYTDAIEKYIKYDIFKIIGEYITYFYTIHEDKIELYLFTQKLILLFTRHKTIT